MTVEIVSVSLKQGIITITANDCSEENLQRMERIRDDGFEKELEFIFDTHCRNDYLYFARWIKRQKVTDQAKTWGEALYSLCGIVTTINGKYRVWE